MILRVTDGDGNIVTVNWFLIALLITVTVVGIIIE